MFHELQPLYPTDTHTASYDTEKNPSQNCLLFIVQLQVPTRFFIPNKGSHRVTPSREQFITEEDYREVAIKRISDAERIIII
jgi:hypothetical protein